MVNIIVKLNLTAPYLSGQIGQLSYYDESNDREH